MGDTSEKVRRITRDLNALLVEVRKSSAAGTPGIIEEILTSEVVGTFKSSMDAMRQLLWIYIEAASQNKNAADQPERLAQAAEMLKILRAGVLPVNFSNTGFVEKVSALVDAYAKEAEKAADAGRTQAAKPADYCE